MMFFIKNFNFYQSCLFLHTCKYLCYTYVSFTFAAEFCTKMALYRIKLHFNAAFFNLYVAVIMDLFSSVQCRDDQPC